MVMTQDSLTGYMVNISLQIRELRKKQGLTQVEFAKRAGVGLRFLRELESGKRTIRMDKLMQVLDFLGYHLELKRTEPQQIYK
jgi:y4mF family transcriptional regulator